MMLTLRAQAPEGTLRSTTGSTRDTPGLMGMRLATEVCDKYVEAAGARRKTSVFDDVGEECVVEVW